MLSPRLVDSAHEDYPTITSELTGVRPRKRPRDSAGPRHHSSSNRLKPDMSPFKRVGDFEDSK